MLECDYYITNKINKNLYEQIIKYTDTYLYNENKNTIALIKCPNVKSYLKNLQVFDSDKLYQMSVAIQPTLFSGKRSASSPNIQVKLPLMKSQTNLNKNDNLCESVKSLKKLLNTPHKKWTNKDVVYWIETLEFKQYCDTFAEHEITGNDLEDITVEQMMNVLKINKLGHALKIKREIDVLVKT